MPAYFTFVAVEAQDFLSGTYGFGEWVLPSPSVTAFYGTVLITSPLLAFIFLKLKKKKQNTTLFLWFVSPSRDF